MLNSYKFLGVRVDNVTMDETMQGIDTAVQNNQPYNVVTINPELVMAATKNVEFNTIINDADVVTPDGIGLLLMGRLTGRPLKERVTGVDLCYRLAQEAAKKGWRIYLLGAMPGVAQKAADNLAKQYPKLTIAGVNSSDPDPRLAKDISRDILAAKPSILLVAYGSPTQELWINHHRSKLDPMVTIGIGGSFDFIAGNAKRAPKITQKLGLEWLWRLITQPHRWRRMLALPKFAILSLFK